MILRHPVNLRTVALSFASFSTEQIYGNTLRPQRVQCVPLFQCIDSTFQKKGNRKLACYFFGHWNEYELQIIFQWPFFFFLNLEGYNIYYHCHILKIFFMLKNYWILDDCFAVQVWELKVLGRNLWCMETSALFTQEPVDQESWENCQMKYTTFRTRGSTFGETYNLNILVRTWKKKNSVSVDAIF